MKKMFKVKKSIKESLSQGFLSFSSLLILYEICCLSYTCSMLNSFFFVSYVQQHPNVFVFLRQAITCDVS